jgi:hypothetical protein
VAERNTGEVLRRVREILSTCQLGLRDLTGEDPARRIPGLYNVVVFGRATTIAVQNLRNIEDEFEEWYEPHQKAMEDDPLMKYFSRLRNTILKEGGATVSSSLYIEHLDTADLAPLMENPPPGAKSFFIGDNVGGSGWEIELGDGSTAKYYVQLPESVLMSAQLNFPDPPTEHKGHPVEDTSVENLASLYVDFLVDFVKEAESRFGEPTSSS